MAAAPVRRLLGGQTQPSAVGGEIVKKLRFNGVYKFSDNLVEIGTFVADNVGIITFPIGAYTYRMWQMVLIAPNAIAGETDPRGGFHVVKTAFLSKYLDDLQIEINGTIKWHVKAAEQVMLNAYHNLDVTEGVLKFQFGAPNMHNTDLAEDAYQFGTGNLRSVKLRVKTKAAWVTGMRVEVGCEYAPVVRPIGYFVTTTRYGYTAPGAGAFTITDLAAGIDFSTLFVQAASVSEIYLEIDRREIVSSHMWQLRALHEAWGKDVNALGNGFIIDNFRDGDAIGFDSVSNSEVERSRNADVRLQMTMQVANTPIDIVCFHCGLFGDQ